ncbi:MAG: hypothetical protein EPN93_17475 [Spirochaetes bacterium]|nr:MAG: hypothetical protein EPN93_17475 [Spirochaetota bacterium]
MGKDEEIKDASSSEGVASATSGRRIFRGEVRLLSWIEWTKELKVDKAIARGACAGVNAEWEAPVDKDTFERAVKIFAEARHG